MAEKSDIELLQQAAAELKKLRTELARVKREQAANQEPIAVIGMSCRFPGGSNSPEAFWDFVRAGKDGIVETAKRWELSYPGEPAEMQADGRWAGLIDNIDMFDADFFGISPREANFLDPQQRLLLEVAWEALERAGYPASRLNNSQTGVFVGQTVHDYEAMLQPVYDLRQEAYAVTGAMAAMLAGRISYLFGLRGPSMAIDTACSSSLVALHVACNSLRNQESDLALVGGVNVVASPTSMRGMNPLQALSTDGRCKTFDAAANGYVRSEGCGVVILKRLAAAERDGDNILAVIRGSSVNQDGRSSGLTTPNPVAQVALLKRALGVSHLSPADIGYIEAHGTGTPLGDPIEIDALREVFGDPRPDGSSLYISSVKTNMGHAEAAAGMAGLIKVVLSLQNEAIPKHLHLKALNPRVRLQGSPFVIPTEARPWPRSSTPRRAGISSFGFSGTNAHVIVEEAPVAKPMAANATAPSLLPLSAKTATALSQVAARMAAYLRSPQGAGARLEDVAYTAGVRRTHDGYRAAVLGVHHKDWCEALDAVAAGQRHPRAVSGGSGYIDEGLRTLFVFPGQGSQWLGMGRDLLDHNAVFCKAMEACDAAIRAITGWSVTEELRAPAERSRLEQIDVVQPTLFALQVSLAAVWQSWGVVPQHIIGHSMGEVAASHVAGALTLEDAARVICLRSQLMKRVAGKGAMVAVEMDRAAARSLADTFQGKLCVAVDNGPQATVIAGDVQAIEALEAQLKAQNLFARRVKTDVAFHSSHMDGLCAELQAGLATLRPQAPRIPMFSTVTGEPMGAVLHDAAYWVRNLRECVQFAPVLTQLRGDATSLFVEVSAHPVLMPVINRALQGPRGQPPLGVAVASLRRDTAGLDSLLLSLGELYAQGWNVDFQKQHTGARRVEVLPTYPWQHRKFWLELPQQSGRAAQVAKQPGADPNSYLAHDWVNVPLPQEGACKPGDMWVVLGGDPAGFGNAVQTALAARGARVALIPPSGDFPKNLAQVFAEAPNCKGIVHLWSMLAPSAEKEGLAALEKATRWTVDSVIHLVQGMMKHGWRRMPRLWMGTRGFQRLDGDAGDVAVEQGTLWGLARTLSYEHMEMRPTAVDVRFGNGPLAVEHMAEAFVRDLLADGNEQELALRPGSRYAARLVRRQPALPTGVAGDAPVCKADGTYLVTGGLGGLGLFVAKWLVEQGAENMVLVSRRPASTAEQEAALARLAPLCNVVTMQGDVANRSQMEAVFGRISREMPPLRGIVHAAGVMGADGLVAEAKTEEYPPVLAPKILGGWNLHELSKDCTLDFFALYTSISALIGSPREAAYVVGNCFLDGLAAYRRAHKLPVTAVNWGPFADVGMVEQLLRSGMQMVSRGLHLIPPQQSVEALGYLIRAGVSHAGYAPLDADQWWEFYPQLAGTGKLSTLLSAKARQKAENQRSFLQRFQAADADDRVLLLQRFVSEQVAAVLRREATHIETKAPFASMGIDSLMGLELRNTLETSLKIKLPADMVYSRPNMVALVTYLAKELETQRGAGTQDDVTFETIHGKGATTIYARDLRIDRFIAGPDAEAKTPERLAALARPPKVVLLTGANGFLGRFLTMELLERLPADGKVICVVRAANDHEATQRMLQVYANAVPEMKQRFEALAAGGRLQVVAGDTTKPGLGFAQSTFDTLASAVDCIVHNGALVNHAFAYNDLFDANVRGTAEVIRFAMHKRFKALCYMSSVGMIEGLKRDGMVYETEDAESLWQERPVTGRYGTGYSTTKWACEVLIRDANRKWGLPANVFRCPLLLPHSRYPGQTNTTDLFIRLLLTMLHTGYAPPNIFEDPNATGFAAFPVDFAAKCLAELATGGTTGFNNYNIAPPDDGKQGSFVVYVADKLRSAGYPVQSVPDYHQWHALADARLQALAEHPGAKMGAPVMILMKNPMPTPPIYDVTHFSARMAAANLWAQAPRFDEAYILKCLRDLIDLNLLHQPGANAVTPSANTSLRV